MELDIIKILSSETDLDSVYNIYKALKSSGYIEENKIIKDTNDRDIFFYLMKNIVSYSFDSCFINFVKDYAEKKENSIFFKNKYGYTALNDFIDNFSKINPIVLPDFFDFIFDKCSEEEIKEIFYENYKSRFMSLAYETKNYELIDFFHKNKMDVVSFGVLSNCFFNKENMEYFIKKNPDLNLTINMDGEEKPYWSIFLEKSSMSLLPIIEKWCEENLSNENYQNKKIEKMKKQLNSSKSCDILKKMDNWENLFDEKEVSLVRYAIDKDPSHANKLTLKKSIDALQRLDDKGHNVWFEIFSNLTSVHSDAIKFCIENVDMSKANNNCSILEEFYNNKINMNMAFYDFKNLATEKMKLFKNINPEKLLGSPDFLVDILNNPNSLSKNFNYLVHSLLYQSKCLDQIENKELLGYYMIYNMRNEKFALDEKGLEKQQRALELGALPPKNISAEFFEETFSDNIDLLAGLRRNLSIKEKEELTQNLISKEPEKNLKKRI